MGREREGKGERGRVEGWGCCGGAGGRGGWGKEGGKGRENGGEVRGEGGLGGLVLELSSALCFLSLSTVLSIWIPNSSHSFHLSLSIYLSLNHV